VKNALLSTNAVNLKCVKHTLNFYTVVIFVTADLQRDTVNNLQNFKCQAPMTHLLFTPYKKLEQIFAWLPSCYSAFHKNVALKKKFHIFPESTTTQHCRTYV